MHCKECNKEFNNLPSMARHRSKIHNISCKQTYVDYKLNGIYPTCKCGCNEIPKFLGTVVGFREHKRGHISRIHNNWGHNPKARESSIATKKQKWDNNEYSVWNKGLTIVDPRVKANVEKVINSPGRGEKISKALTGVPKSAAHKEKLSEIAYKRWKDPEYIQKWTNSFSKEPSGLEEYFAKFLDNLNVEYQQQYPLEGFIFDFFLPQYNILIEIDGNFWHCNPKLYSSPIYPFQKNNMENDLKKNKYCENRGLKLLRFWENEIKNNSDYVINILKENLK